MSELDQDSRRKKYEAWKYHQERHLRAIEIDIEFTSVRDNPDGIGTATFPSEQCPDFN